MFLTLEALEGRLLLSGVPHFQVLRHNDHQTYPIAAPAVAKDADGDHGDHLNGRILAPSIQVEVHVSVGSNTPESDEKRPALKKVLENSELALELVDWVKLAIPTLGPGTKSERVLEVVKEFVDQHQKYIENGGHKSPTALELTERLEDYLQNDTANGGAFVFTRISYQVYEGGKLVTRTTDWTEYKGGADTHHDALGTGVYGSSSEAWEDAQAIQEYVENGFKKANEKFLEER